MAQVICSECGGDRFIEGPCGGLSMNVLCVQCSEFVIEFDSKLVFDLGASPKEITAALLHEIGHKVFYTQTQIRAKATLALEVIKMVGV